MSARADHVLLAHLVQSHTFIPRVEAAVEAALNEIDRLRTLTEAASRVIEAASDCIDLSGSPAGAGAWEDLTLAVQAYHANVNTAFWHEAESILSELMDRASDDAVVAYDQPEADPC